MLAKAVDALGDRLDDCESVAAQARAVRDYVESQAVDPRPSERTVRAFITAYRRPLAKTLARNRAKTR